MSIKEVDSLKPYVFDINLPDVQFLAISQDVAHNLEMVRPFAEDHQWMSFYKVLTDTGRTIPVLYGIEALPTTIAIDRTGNIVLRWTGYRAGDELLIVDTLRALFGR